MANFNYEKKFLENKIYIQTVIWRDNENLMKIF